MKALLVTTAIAMATAGSAFAMITANDLPAQVRWEVQRLVPNADLSHITKAQAARIRTLFGDPDSDSTSTPVLRAQIERALGMIS